MVNSKKIQRGGTDTQMDFIRTIEKEKFSEEDMRKILEDIETEKVNINDSIDGKYDTLSNEFRWASYTPLTAAVSANHSYSLKIVNILIDEGADINKPDESGKTPLFIASKSGKTDKAKALLDYGADTELGEFDKREKSKFDKRGKSKITPLHIAALYSRWKIIDILLKNHANANVKNYPAGDHLFISMKAPLGRGVNHEVNSKIYTDLLMRNAIDNGYTIKLAEEHNLKKLFEQIQDQRKVIEETKDKKNLPDGVDDIIRDYVGGKCKTKKNRNKKNKTKTVCKKRATRKYQKTKK